MQTTYLVKYPISLDGQKLSTLNRENMGSTPIGVTKKEIVESYKLNIHFVIHCDIGHAGKTQALIKEIVSWVQSCGYECQTAIQLLVSQTSFLNK